MVDNREVLLVIRADYGTFLATPMKLTDAVEIVKKHREGKLPPRIGGEYPYGGGCWSVDSSKIVLCHTQEMEQIKPQQGQQFGQLPIGTQWRGSGY